MLRTVLFLLLIGAGTSRAGTLYQWHWYHWAWNDEISTSGPLDGQRTPGSYQGHSGAFVYLDQTISFVDWGWHDFVGPYDTDLPPGPWREIKPANFVLSLHVEQYFFEWYDPGFDSGLDHRHEIVLINRLTKSTVLHDRIQTNAGVPEPSSWVLMTTATAVGIFRVRALDQKWGAGRISGW